MINNLGEWEEEKDYSKSSQEHWCDMDYVAAWVRSKAYEPKTSMKNLVLMVLCHYDDEVEETMYEDGNVKYYFAVPDNRPYPENLMVNIPDVEAYVEASGGLKEFDYYC